MTTWKLTRAIITALAFLSISTTLAALPGRALDFWHLYFSPVMIAALSFGVSGALVATGATVAAMVALYLRFDQVADAAANALLGLLPGVGAGGTAGLDSAATAMWLRLGDGVVSLRNPADLLNSTVFGVAILAGLSALVGWLVDENRKQQARYQYEARTDELTGVGNYRSLMEALGEEIARAARFGRPLAYLMIDVDSLKPYNDTYGHQVGDVVLRQIGQTLRGQVREIDVVCRYGGDEFAVILLEPSLGGAIVAAERLRRAVADLAVTVRGIEARVTVSIGGAVYPEDGASTAELVAAADTALYAAKSNGKNQVRMAERPHPAPEAGAAPTLPS